MAPLLNMVITECTTHLPPDARVIIAVSGGPDSQCLLDLLARARSATTIHTIIAAGIDHGLRPEAPQELDFS